MYTWRQTKSRASWRDAKLTGKLFSTEVETDGHAVFWGFRAVWVSLVQSRTFMP